MSNPWLFSICIVERARAQKQDVLTTFFLSFFHFLPHSLAIWLQFTSLPDLCTHAVHKPNCAWNIYKLDMAQCSALSMYQRTSYYCEGIQKLKERKIKMILWMMWARKKNRQWMPERILKGYQWQQRQIKCCW